MIHRNAHTHYVLAFTFCLFFAGCTSKEAAIKPSNIDTLAQYWLTTSMYAGRFYDDDNLKLLDYRPFSAIDDVETLDGMILYPKNPDQIIPVGSLVKIEHISYPSSSFKQLRPIYSPRNNIWVYLFVAKDRGNVSIFHEKRYVLVAPRSITNEQQLRTYLAKFLSIKDPHPSFLQLPSHLQQAIFEKRPLLGMKKEQILATLGPASKKQFLRKTQFDEAQEIWHFFDYLIVFTNDEVSAIKPLQASQIKTN